MENGKLKNTLSHVSEDKQDMQFEINRTNPHMLKDNKIQFKIKTFQKNIKTKIMNWLDSDEEGDEVKSEELCQD